MYILEFILSLFIKFTLRGNFISTYWTFLNKQAHFENDIYPFFVCY